MATQQDAHSGLYEKITRLRDEIDEVKVRLAWLNDAPLPLDEAKSNADALVEKLADCHGQGRITGLFYADGYRNLFELSGRARLEGGITAVDAGPVLAWLFPDLVRQRLHTMLEQEAQTLECGPPAAERKAQRAKQEKRLFELEIQEEQLIEQAESQGLEIYRRADVNPAAVIGIF
jgi:hypothetical protein